MSDGDTLHVPFENKIITPNFSRGIFIFLSSTRLFPTVTPFSKCAKFERCENHSFAPLSLRSSSLSNFAHSLNDVTVWKSLVLDKKINFPRLIMSGRSCAVSWCLFPLQIVCLQCPSNNVYVASALGDYYVTPQSVSSFNHSSLHKQKTDIKYYHIQILTWAISVPPCEDVFLTLGSDIKWKCGSTQIVCTKEHFGWRYNKDEKNTNVETISVQCIDCQFTTSPITSDFHYYQWTRSEVIIAVNCAEKLPLKSACAGEKGCQAFTEKELVRLKMST